MMFDFKNKCWLFHNWEKSYENYNILIPEHYIPIGSITIYEPENIQSVKFLIRTCQKCGLRQKKRMLSEGWDNWNHHPNNNIIKSKIVHQTNMII